MKNSRIKHLFPYVYGLFILAQFMIGQIYIPGLPINILQISTLLTLSFCFVIEHKIPNDKYMIMYFVFLFFYFISAGLTGYPDRLIHILTSQLPISITIYWATKILIQKYNTLLPIAIPAIIAGVIDSIITISQAIGNPILSPIIVMLMQNTEATDLVIQDGVLGISICGLFANPVFNGHALLFCFVSSLFAVQGRYKLPCLICSTIILTGLFFCQQRSAFYLSIFTLVFIGWKIMHNNSKTRIKVILSLLFILLYILPYIESYALETNSRIIDTNMTGRDTIWKYASDFIQNNLLLGGYDLFVQQTGKYPHNIFFSAFLAGGLIGGFILLLMISNLFIGALKSLRYYNNTNTSLLVSTCLVITLIGDSFSHNTGWVEIDFASFLATSLCLYYNEKNPQKRFII